MTTAIKNVHPLAELFPMLNQTELAALADDIKANGLREPIRVTEDGTLVEGRNRLEACKLAKVEPRFEIVNGDAGDLILSANIFRRHLTNGQIAILAVVAETGGTLPKNDSTLKDDATDDPKGRIEYDYRRQAHKRVEKLVKATLIDHAAQIVRWAPDHARMVLDTGKGWNEAREIASQRSQEAKSDEARIFILEQHAPELLAQVSDDGLILAQAWRLYEDKRRQERETKNRLTGYLVDRIKPLLGKTDAEELVENYDPDHASRTIGIAELDEAITYLSAIRSEMKRRKKG